METLESNVSNRDEFGPTFHGSELALANEQELDCSESSDRIRLISTGTSPSRIYALVTTILDIGFAIGVLLFFGWLLALIAIAIRLDSKGPALFRQERVGRGKRTFICWKFRTMAAGTAHRATHEMSVSSVTRVGGFLRRTKLDELPQVVNLLRRELSLVGPRPCLPNQVELIEARDRRRVYSIRPGITGLAQVNDIDMSDPETLAIWDERYCALRSIPFDLKILVRTFVGKGSGDRVQVP